MTDVLRPAYDAEGKPYCPRCVRQSDMEDLDPAPSGAPAVTIGKHELAVARRGCDEHDVALPEVAAKARERDDRFDSDVWKVVDVETDRGKVYETLLPAPEFEQMVADEELIEDGENLSDRVTRLGENNAPRDCADCGASAVAYVYAPDHDGCSSRFLCPSCLGKEPAARP